MFGGRGYPATSGRKYGGGRGQRSNQNTPYSKRGSRGVGLSSNNQNRGGNSPANRNTAAQIKPVVAVATQKLPVSEKSVVPAEGK